MAVYKVVLNGQAYGQDIKNVLYYRNGVGVDIGGLTVGGTEEVAQAVKAMVWPAMRTLLPEAFTMQDVQAYVYDEQDFHLLYQNPVSVGVQQAGTAIGETNGPATCAIIKFILEPHIVLVNGPKPPKRGYMAFGPLIDSLVNSDGTINKAGGQTANWAALCAVLANNVETILPIPAVFYPVRVHQDRIGPGFPLVITSFADIRDAIVRNQSSFRRSRQPES